MFSSFRFGAGEFLAHGRISGLLPAPTASRLQRAQVVKSSLL